MSKTSDNTSIRHNPRLASIQCLKYLGIVLVVLSLYVVAQFYFHYGDDIFSKSLTVGQHIKLSIYSIGSMLSNLFIPLFFFSGALVYRLVRLKGINLLSTLKRDFFIIIPLGIALWFYGAFFEEPVKRSFYTMIFDVQTLEPGEKLVQDPSISQLMKMPNLNGLYEEIDTLNTQIMDVEGKLMNQSNAHSSLVRYIEQLHYEQDKYQDEVRLIHVTPIYVLLFLLFGMLVGYLISFHLAALTAILIAIAYSWYYMMSVLEVSFIIDDSNKFWFVLSKVGVLLLVNTVLLILASKANKRSNEVYV